MDDCVASERMRLLVIKKGNVIIKSVTIIIVLASTSISLFGVLHFTIEQRTIPQWRIQKKI